MREGSARGRLGGRDCSEAAEADCPTKAGQEVVGSVEATGLRTTLSLARGADTGDHPTDQRKGRERVQVQSSQG